MNLPAKPAIANRNCNARRRGGEKNESQIVEFEKKSRREKFRAG